MGISICILRFQGKKIKKSFRGFKKLILLWKLIEWILAGLLNFSASKYSGTLLVMNFKNPEKCECFSLFVMVFACYVTEGTFWSKTFWLKSIQEKFISSLSESFAAGFVRAALEVSGSQLELRKTSEEKDSGKCSIFHIFPNLVIVSHEVLLHLNSIHPHDLFDYLFLKVFRYKNKRSRIVTKRIVAPLTKITIPLFRGNFYSENFETSSES